MISLWVGLVYQVYQSIVAVVLLHFCFCFYDLMETLESAQWFNNPTSSIPEKNGVRPLLSASRLLERRRIFHHNLVDVVKQHHKVSNIPCVYCTFPPFGGNATFGEMIPTGGERRSHGRKATPFTLEGCL